MRSYSLAIFGYASLSRDRRRLLWILILSTWNNLPYVFICFPVCLLVFSFEHSFLRSFVQSFVCSLIHSFVHSFRCSFVCSFVCLFMHSFIHSFVCLFVHSFICLFVVTWIGGLLGNLTASVSLCRNIVISMCRSLINMLFLGKIEKEKKSKQINLKGRMVNHNYKWFFSMQSNNVLVVDMNKSVIVTGWL